MLRVLVLSCLLGLACADAYRLKFAQMARVVKEAGHILKNTVVDREYNVFEPELHYLMLIGVVQSAAEIAAKIDTLPTARKAFLHAIQHEIPQILLKPSEKVNAILELQNRTRDKVQPILVLVDEVCDNLADSECDAVVEKLIGQQEKLLNSVQYLYTVSSAAEGFLARQPRWKEVSEGLDIVPYLMDNLKDLTYYVWNLANFFRILRK